MKTKARAYRTFKQPDYTNGLLVFIALAFAGCALAYVGI